MTERRRGLGRGLGALIPAARLDETNAVEHEPLVAVGASYGGLAVAAAPAPVTERDGELLDGQPAAPDGVGAGPQSPGTGPADALAPEERYERHVADGPEQALPGLVGSTSAALAADHELAADQAVAPAAPGAAVTVPVAAAADAQSPVIGARFAELEVAVIRPNPRQPRQVFDEEELAELVHSIREIGILQPVVVRELPAGEDAGFELVMGERRWRAAREAGLATVPAIIRDTPDTAMLRDALLENLHRAQLNPLEEAAAYDQLLQDFGCTQEQLAERIGRSRPQISNTLRLLRLPPSVQRRLAAGVLSAGHARALLSLPAAAQERLAQRVVAEGLSVRSVEEIVAVGAAEPPGRGVAVRTRTVATPEMADLAERVANALDTRVRVDVGRTKGKLVIEFASAADLERIVHVMTGSAGTATAEMST